MKTTILIIGLVVAAFGVFILGLVPGERLLSAPDTDSYVLIGVARFASWTTGLCEFLLGGIAALVVMMIVRRARMPKQL